MASETAAIGIRPGRPAPWRDPRLRGIALQAVFVAVIAGIIGFLAYNTTVNPAGQSPALELDGSARRPQPEAGAQPLRSEEGEELRCLVRVPRRSGS